MMKKAHHETEVQYLCNGWSYRKNFNAGEFILTYRFAHKNFRLVRCLVICPVSGFRVSDVCIKKFFMHANLF